jgi:hypothetical protein
VESGERLTDGRRRARVGQYMKEAADMILDPSAAQYFRELMDDEEEDTGD